MSTLTHWKKLINPDYLGAYSLTPGEEKILTIKSVVREKVTGTGGKKQECTVVHWVESEKPMILNRINSKTITKIYGTPYIEEWAGKKIKIFAELVDAFGEQVEALRVRAEQILPPVLNPEMKAWKAAVQHLREGGDIAKIAERFTLTDEIKRQMKNESEQ